MAKAVLCPSSPSTPITDYGNTFLYEVKLDAASGLLLEEMEREENNISDWFLPCNDTSA